MLVSGASLALVDPVLSASAAGCPAINTAESLHIPPLTNESVLIVVATVSSSAAGAVVLLPEAYLKGAATGAPVVLERSQESPCDAEGFVAGERVLVFLKGSGFRMEWPYQFGVYVLEGGRAHFLGGGDDRPESDLIARIRGITGQYAILPASADDGAAIEWWTTVVPVSAALLVVFAIGLVLMRTWHRIDPS